MYKKNEIFYVFSVVFFNFLLYIAFLKLLSIHKIYQTQKIKMHKKMRFFYVFSVVFFNFLLYIFFEAVVFIFYSINSYWIIRKQKRIKIWYLCRRNSNIIKKGQRVTHGAEQKIRCASGVMHKITHLLSIDWP